MRDAVIDTNVLVSALLRAAGPPGRILDLILSGELRPVFDDRIFLEYRQVLSRPLFGFQPQDVADLLEQFEFSGWWVIASPLAVVLPDPYDLPYLEAAVETKALIITGNIRHFPPAVIQKSGIHVFFPAKYLERFG